MYMPDPPRIVARRCSIHTCRPFLQASAKCYEPQDPKVLPGFQPVHLHAKTRRAVPAPEVKPEKWSHDEAYFRSGVHPLAGTYVPNEFGGARRRLPLFAQDAGRTNKDECSDCNKRRHAHGALGPGVLVRARPCWLPYYWALRLLACEHFLPRSTAECAVQRSCAQLPCAHRRVPPLPRGFDVFDVSSVAPVLHFTSLHACRCSGVWRVSAHCRGH